MKTTVLGLLALVFSSESYARDQLVCIGDNVYLTAAAINGDLFGGAGSGMASIDIGNKHYGVAVRSYYSKGRSLNIFRDHDEDVVIYLHSKESLEGTFSAHLSLLTHPYDLTCVIREID